MEVKIIPLLKDNYGYILKCKTTGVGAFVDVAHNSAQTVMDELDEFNLKHFVILSTHKHSDHCGGNLEMKLNFPDLKVYGGIYDSIPGVTHNLQDQDVFNIGEMQILVLHAPCHTKGHVLYYVTHPSSKEKLLFTGDTIFVGGVGAFFEGNTEQMVKNIEKIIKLPYDTKIYCGHEYALQFLPNAAKLDKENIKVFKKLEYAIKCKEEGLPCMPTTLQDELETNMYIRSVTGSLKGLVSGETPEEIMNNVYQLV